MQSEKRIDNQIIQVMEEDIMNDKKIQTMLNVEILNRMNDKSAASVLKNILFNPNNHIDWNEAYQLMMAFMPELNTIEGYKKENVTTYTDFITDLDKMRDFFEIPITFKIGVESFDYDFRNKYLNKNAKFKFEAAGYKIPHLVFWNVDARMDSVPMIGKDGYTLVSGFSPSIFEMVMTRTTPEEFMNSVIYSERYQPVLETLKNR